MMCCHCEASVREVLEAVGGVEVLSVSHESGLAIVCAPANVKDKTLKKAITAIDYKVISVTRE